MVLSVYSYQTRCQCSEKYKHKKPKKDSFCVCKGKSKRIFDVDNLKNLYYSGKRTEYTDFAALQENNGGAKLPRLSGLGYNRPFREYETSTPKCG